MKKKKDEITIRSSAAEYLTYVASGGDQQDSVEMRYEDENIWLTQRMMATLYDVGLPTINEHIKKIYADSELEETATIRNFRIVQTEGSRQVTRDTKHYNLQMIIAVGFKVNSERAVQFRKWVNQIAKDYTIKGWVMDDERLKRGTKALHDPKLRAELLATKKASQPFAAFCSKCRELGYEIYDMDLITAGEEAYAAMRRSTNGGGENSPMLEGEDDLYELFFAGL